MKQNVKQEVVIHVTVVITISQCAVLMVGLITIAAKQGVVMWSCNIKVDVEEDITEGEEEEVAVIMEVIQELVKEVVELDITRLGKMDIDWEALVTQEDEKSYNLFFVFKKEEFFLLRYDYIINSQIEFNFEYKSIK